MLLEKILLWFMRLVQWSLCLALLGISGHFASEFGQAKSKVPPEVWVPLITSAFAMCIMFYSILLLYCLGRLLLHIAAFFDFCFMVAYIAAVILNRFNFHGAGSGEQNQLWQKLVYVREAAGLDPDADKNNSLVRAMVGLTTTLMVIFIITTLMCINLAHQADERHDAKGGRRRSVRSDV